MSLYAMIRNAYDPDTEKFHLSADDIETKGHLDGNLCRCTGYKPILEAAKTFITEDIKGQIVDRGSDIISTSVNDERSDGASYLEANLPRRSKSSMGSCGRPGGCCRDDPGIRACSSDKTSEPEKLLGGEAHSSRTSIFDGDISPRVTKASSVPQFNFKRYSPLMELIYPPGLSKHDNVPICYGNSSKTWFRPVNLYQLLELMSTYPSAKIVGGASEIQVELRFMNASYAVSVFIGDIPELGTIIVPLDLSTMDKVIIGGNASLTDIENTCSDLSSKLGQRGSVFGAMAKALRYFAGRQIRNVASLAGNIATASPISDMNPVLLAANATVTAYTGLDVHIIPMSTMFRGYRKTALPLGSVVTAIHVPVPPPGATEFTKSYKQAKRKDDDIAIVTAGFRVRLDSNSVVEDVSLAYGGMAPMTILAKETCGYLMGKNWAASATLDAAVESLLREFDLPFDVPGGMATYRRTLAISLFVRFWNEIIAELKLGEVDEGLVDEIHRSLTFGTRDNHNPHEQRIVGKQIPHLSGLKHATGEAEYIDDMPRQDRELFGALVLSEKAHANILSVDWSPALGPDLALGHVDKNDIPPELNKWGSIVKDEPFFAINEVHSHGQPIGMVYAETALQAQEAAKAVKVEYEDLPAILTIDQAIEAKSFYVHGKELRKGVSPEKMPEAFASCYKVFEGTTRVGGQEHFYLETNAALVVPNAEDGTMDVWSSTQNT